MARHVKCPVVAVHGDYDPHSSASIGPLAGVFMEFRFVLLKKCAHRPWLEHHARDEFFKVIRAEVASPGALCSFTKVSE